VTAARIHFVLPAAFAEEVERLPDRTLGEDYPYWLGGRFNWPAQSWLALRQYREGLTVGVVPKHGQVNFAHSMTWRALGRRQGEFRVAARADYPRLYDVDFEILQNPGAPRGPRQTYAPYWPLPGIKPRASERRTVLQVAYAGRFGQRNLDKSLREELASHSAMVGMTFATPAPHRWHDMSEVDLLIAVRDFARHSHPNKPPSKLFNAWLANVPLIGGWDSAYALVGRPGIDYVRVGSKADFFSAISRLREDRAFYDSIVAAGRGRALSFSREAVAREWLAIFDGPVSTAFESWRSGFTVGAQMRRAIDLGLDVGRGLKQRMRKTGARTSTYEG
jgi:hypothetical protein